MVFCINYSTAGGIVSSRVIFRERNSASAQTLFEEPANRSEGRSEAGGFSPPRLRELGTSAPLAADLSGQGFDQLAGTETIKEVLAYRDEEIGLAVNGGAEDDHPGWKAIAQLVGKFAQALAVQAFELSRQKLDAGNFAHLCQKFL